MTKAYEFCPICNKNIESVFIENHHVIPTSKGGTVNDILRICGTCHDTIHYFIPIEEIENYKTYHELASHPDMQIYIKWIERKNNTGHWNIKKVLKNINKVA